MDDTLLSPDINNENTLNTGVADEDIEFVSMRTGRKFTAKANYENTEMLKDIISRENYGKEVSNIIRYPINDEVRYYMVDDLKKEYHTPEMSICEYLNTLFVVFIGG